MPGKSESIISTMVVFADATKMRLLSVIFCLGCNYLLKSNFAVKLLCIADLGKFGLQCFSDDLNALLATHHPSSIQYAQPSLEAVGLANICS